MFLEPSAVQILRTGLIKQYEGLTACLSTVNPLKRSKFKAW